MSDRGALLVRQRNRIEHLNGLQHGNAEYTVWLAQTERVVEDLYGKSSSEFEQFESIFRGPFFISTSTPDEVYQKDYLEDLQKARLLLDSFIEDLQSAAPQQGPSTTTPPIPVPSTPSLDVPPPINQLRCPDCHQTNVRFIELREVESTELRGGIHIFGGGRRRTKSVPFYQCDSCGHVFWTEAGQR